MRIIFFFLLILNLLIKLAHFVYVISRKPNPTTIKFNSSLFISVSSLSVFLVLLPFIYHGMRYGVFTHPIILQTNILSGNTTSKIILSFGENERPRVFIAQELQKQIIIPNSNVLLTYFKENKEIFKEKYKHKKEANKKALKWFKRKLEKESMADFNSATDAMSSYSDYLDREYQIRKSWDPKARIEMEREVRIEKKESLKEKKSQ